MSSWVGALIVLAACAKFSGTDDGDAGRPEVDAGVLEAAVPEGGSSEGGEGGEPDATPSLDSGCDAGALPFTDPACKTACIVGSDKCCNGTCIAEAKECTPHACLGARSCPRNVVDGGDSLCCAKLDAVGTCPPTYRENAASLCKAVSCLTDEHQLCSETEPCVFGKVCKPAFVQPRAGSSTAILVGVCETP